MARNREEVVARLSEMESFSAEALGVIRELEWQRDHLLGALVMLLKADGPCGGTRFVRGRSTYGEPRPVVHPDARVVDALIHVGERLRDEIKGRVVG